MNKHLKQVLCMSLSALVIAGTGTFMSANHCIHASRHNRVAKVYHHKNNRKDVCSINRRTHVYRKRITKKRKLTHYSHKHRRSQKSKVRVYKSRFKHSNSKRALKRSGYFDARNIGGNFIFNKYAPNDKRAVVPKKFDGTNWYQGKFGQKNPVGYYYDTQYHGWLRLR